MSGMNLFKSKRENLFHYVTTVTFRRIPIFRSEQSCSLFLQAVREAREAKPFKLVGYVIMPDHAHLFINPLDLDIRQTMNRIKGRSANLILNWLKENNHASSLAKLEINDRRTSASPKRSEIVEGCNDDQNKNNDDQNQNNEGRLADPLVGRTPRPQTHSVWQKGFSSIDVWSEKFAIQKLGYIHANPVRAGLCDHPAKWKWSSYAAYFPHASEIPIEIDKRTHWNFNADAQVRLLNDQG